MLFVRRYIYIYRTYCDGRGMIIFERCFAFPAVYSIRMNRTKSKKCPTLYIVIITDRITPRAYRMLDVPCICIHHAVVSADSMPVVIKVDKGKDTMIRF